MIRQFEGRRPPSLDLFLEYVGLAEEEFYAIATGHQVSPWQFDPRPFVKEKPRLISTSGYGRWPDPADAEDQVGRWTETCASCGSSGACGPG